MIIGGDKIIALDTVGSTNDHLSDKIRDGIISEEGTVVVAKKQSAGKGLENNLWESEPGKNLTFSVLLKPRFLKAERQFQITKIISLAVCDYITGHLTNEQVSIKWPNDIYAGNNKIAGILINNTINGKEIVYSIVGIGININQRTFFSDAPNPVSLRHYLNKDLGLNSCLNDVLSNIDSRYQQLKNNETYQIDSDYHNALYRLNGYNLFRYNNSIVSAKITGVTEYGQLQLLQENGLEITCNLKEIEFVI